MKKRLNKSKRIVVAAAGVLLMVSLASCDFSGLNNAIDNFGVVIGLEPIHTNSVVLITDAKTGELVNAPITVSYEGQNGNDVIDIYSDPKTEDEVKDGIVSFGISNELTPSENSPVEVTLTLQADGYISTSQTISITEEGSSDFSFSLIKKSNTPAGVKTAAQNTSTASDGSTTEEVVVESNTEDEEEVGVAVNIDSGTVFKDEDGNTLKGELTTEIINFDPSDGESLDSYPIDFDAVDESQSDQLAEDEILQAEAQGLFEIRDGNGNAAATSEAGKFAKSSAAGKFRFTYFLPGSRAKVGDLLTVVTVFYIKGVPIRRVYRDQPVKLIKNRRALQFDTPRLVKGFKVGNLIRNATTGTITFNRNGNEGSIYGIIWTYGRSVRLRLRANSNTLNIQRKILLSGNYNILLETPVSLRVNNRFNFFINQNPTFQLPTPPPNIINGTVEVKLQCQNPEQKVAVTDIPAASVVYRKVGAAEGTSWKLASGLEWDFDEENQELTGGRFGITGVEEGAEYEFNIKYDNKRYERTVTITGTTVNYTETITDDICG